MALPEVTERPPYVGGRGWLGVRVDKDLPWSQVASLVEAAHTLCVRIRKTRAR